MDEQISSETGDKLMDLLVKGASSCKGRIVQIFGGLVLWHVIGIVGLLIVSIGFLLVEGIPKVGEEIAKGIGFLSLAILGMSWYLLWELISDRVTRWVALGWIVGYVLQLVIIVIAAVMLFKGEVEASSGVISGLMILGLMGVIGVPLLSYVLLAWLADLACKMFGGFLCG